MKSLDTAESIARAYSYDERSPLRRPSDLGCRPAFAKATVGRPSSVVPPSPKGLWWAGRRLSSGFLLIRSGVWHLASGVLLIPPLCRPSSVVRRLASGFTLIELLVVMVIAVVIMAVSLPSFLSMGRGAGMRTAVNNVRSTVALSRQWAITHREQITFVAKTNEWVYIMTNSTWESRTNDVSCYYATNAEGALVQSVTALPLDVKFDDTSLNVMSLTFKTDGGLTIGAGTEKIVLVDKRNNLVKTTISINGLTGGIRVE